MSTRPALLLAEPDATARLRAVDVLRESFVVTVLTGDEPPVRLARRLRPEVVLLALPRVRHKMVLRTCRALKTELNVTYRVGLLDRSRRLVDPSASLEDWLADGYLGGAYPADDLAAFAAALVADARPVDVHPVASGLLGRWLGRE